MKLLGLSLILCCISGIAQAKLQTSTIKSQKGPASVLFEYEAPNFDLKSAPQGHKAIKIRTLYPNAQFGAPEVFTTGKLLHVPHGYKPVLTVLENDEDIVPNVLLAPVQRKNRCGSHGVSAILEKDLQLYSSEGTYPEEVSRIERIGQMQGIDIARVAFQPFRQDFARGSLIVSQRVVVRVDFVRDTAATKPSPSSPTFKRLLTNMTVNGDVVDAIRDHDVERMLIVTADQLKANIAPLVEWKVAKGLEVDVVTFREAGGSKEAVRDYIQNNYNDKRDSILTYVLLVGNARSMPPFFRSTSNGSAASDYPFSLLEGNDELPDVLMGRIMADNSDKADLIISRILDYEKTVESDVSWYPKGTTIASREGSNPSDVQYAEQIQDAQKAHTYQAVDQFYQGQGNATPRNISAALDEGRSWLTYIGHGSGTAWGSTNGYFKNSDISRLNNPKKLPVIIDVACQNGSFARIDTCFGEAWVTHTANGQNAGAVGYYGGSVNVSWHPPAIMSVGSAKYHFEKEAYKLGATTFAGQLYLIEQSGMTSSTIDNMEWYNLFGDPSMTMRTDSPKSYRLDYVALSTGERNGVQVKAVDVDGNAVEGLTVTLSKAGQFSPIATGKTNSQGFTQLDVAAGDTAQGKTLTATGYNAETQVINISL